MANESKQVGASGLDQNNGFIKDDFMREMQGRNKYKNLNEMRLNSPIVGAVMTAIKFPIRNIGWFYVSDEGDDDPRLELLNESRDNMTQAWGVHLFEALTMLEFGFCPAAIQYRRDNGRILWDRFMMMGQDTVMRWNMQDGRIMGLWQWPHVYQPEVPIDRIVLYRINVERNNPEGRSLLRNAYTSYYYVRNLEPIEAIGKERGMAGIPVIKLPEGADTTSETTATSDSGKAAKIVRNIRIDEQSGVVLPFGWELDLLNTGVNSELAMNTTIGRHESRILLSMLAQSLILGLNGVGTQAKAETDMELFTIMFDAIADVIAESHTRQAIPRLLELNGMDTKGIRLEHSPPGEIDLAVFADFIQKLGDKITWTASDEVMTREIGRMPAMTVDQIKEIREEETLRKAEAQRQFRQRLGDQGNEPDGDPEQQFAVSLPPASVAGNAPDDDERLKQERRWKQAGLNYFKDAARRVERGARQIVR